ncbi:hypothetical protein AB0J72_25460 [Dactylosporangium sp. NPDC049742]|uniref:hypothetical protein n=1 Tax=Dactylosporangium sp. NPDC049742 TaxID=3154737 RepID=UPI003428D1F3
MADVEPNVRAFLAALGGAGSVEMFADPFLFADAGGARPVSRADFLATLPRRAQMFAAAGYGAAQLTSTQQQRLDEHYLLVRTDWSAPSLAGGEAAELSSSYLLREDGTSVSVVAYVNHKTVPGM